VVGRTLLLLLIVFSSVLVLLGCIFFPKIAWDVFGADIAPAWLVKALGMSTTKPGLEDPNSGAPYSVAHHSSVRGGKQVVSSSSPQQQLHHQHHVSAAVAVKATSGSTTQHHV
jgi:hypothetical protein